MVELLATIIILAILSTLAVVGVTKYLNQSYQATYQDFEKNLESAAKNMLISHNKYIPAINASLVIDADYLVCAGYSDILKNPKDNSQTCEDNSYVVIQRKPDVGFNMDITYDACLRCGKYKSAACQSIDITGITRIQTNDQCEVITNE